MSDAVTQRMARLVDEIWNLERNLVCDDYDRAVDIVCGELPFHVHEFATGEATWSWEVPHKWECHEAWIETMDGRRLVDYADHPLQVAVYSCGVDAVVPRDELLGHLTQHPLIPEAVPYWWKHFKDDWAFCCTKSQYEAIEQEEECRVHIRVTEEPGTMKVCDYFLPGTSDQEIILCAHLCHPCMANDDLTGVVVAMDVMRALQERDDRKYGYRLLLVPESLGSVAWLSRHEHLIPKTIAGLFLEMLGTDCPHALQYSYQGDTDFDYVARRIVRETAPGAWFGPYRRVIGNDEAQLNAPGARIPTLSLSRVFPHASGKWPYPEYHSNLDTPDIINWQHMRESVDLALSIIDGFEKATYPNPHYKGELFCTPHGLFHDFYKNPNAYWVLIDVIHALDGSLSDVGISEDANLPLPAVTELLETLEEKGLLSFAALPTDCRHGR